MCDVVRKTYTALHAVCSVMQTSIEGTERAFPRACVPRAAEAERTLCLTGVLGREKTTLRD